MVCEKIERLERYLCDNLPRQSPENTGKTSIRFDRKMELMLKAHLRGFNKKYQVEWGLRRYVSCVIIFAVEQLDRNKISGDYADITTGLEEWNELTDEQLFRMGNEQIKGPRITASPLMFLLNFDKFPEHVNHICSVLSELIGTQNKSEIIRLLIMWTFCKSEFFDIYRVENTYNIRYYLSRLEPYIIEPVENNMIVNLVDGEEEEEEEEEEVAQ